MSASPGALQGKIGASFHHGAGTASLHAAMQRAGLTVIELIPEPDALTAARLQGQRVAEHAAAWPAAGERADEVDGVDLDVLAVAAVAEGAAGRPVKHICSALGRYEAWFHKWWRRYLEAGPEGLYDLTRANHQLTWRIPPELERAILSIRRRLQAHATPATRYGLIGGTAIRAELKALGIRPVPAARTIERVLQWK